VAKSVTKVLDSG